MRFGIVVVLASSLLGCGTRTGLEQSQSTSGFPPVNAAACGPFPTPPNILGIAFDQRGPDYLAVDDEYVYWAQTLAPGHELMRVPKASGVVMPSVVSTDATNATGIARDGDRVYWLVSGDSSRLLSAPATGGPPTVHWSGGHNSTDLVVASGKAFLVSTGLHGDDGSIDSVDLASSVGTSIATGLTHPHNLVHVGTTLYWAHGDDAASEIDELGDDGRGPKKVVVKAPKIAGIAADASVLYWVSGANLYGALRAGGAPRLLATDFSGARIAVDANCVYGDGISRVPKTGGSVARSGTAGRIDAMDDDAVYHAIKDVSGSLYRFGK